MYVNKPWGVFRRFLVIIRYVCLEFVLFLCVVRECFIEDLSAFFNWVGLVGCLAGGQMLIGLLALAGIAVGGRVEYT